MMLILGLAALAAAAPTLSPKGPWVLEAEQDYCAIRREFTRPDATAITLEFQPVLNTNGLQVIVMSGDRASRPTSGRAAVAIGSNGQTINGPYTSGSNPDKSLRVTKISLDRDILADLQDGDSVSVSADPVAATFALTSVAKMRSALRDCTTELFKSWGVEGNDALASPPSIAGNPGGLFGYDNYPAEAVRNHVQGRVVLALSIDTSGAVRRCKVVVSPSPLLDEGSCRAAMRVRFQPARTKSGAPVAATYLLPVRWVLPGG